MKGKVLRGFAGMVQGHLFRASRGDIIEIIDWGWVNGGLVEPIYPDGGPSSGRAQITETATIAVPEKAVRKPSRKRK